MKTTKVLFIASIFLSINIFIGQEVKSQDSLSVVEDQYKDDLKFMVNSFQTILNLLGDEDISRQDKDEIISTSYLKYFENDKVQIEDDLDPNRQLPINKNVQSYLQDVVFFYKSIEFKFEISEVSKGLNDKDQVYYKVSLEERLEGENLYGEPLKEVNQRYIELNLNEQAQEFKIVSVYTTKLSEKEDMATWWNEMDLPWRNYFAPSLFINDSTSIDSILFSYAEIAIDDTVYTTAGDTVYFNSEALYSSIKNTLHSTSIHIVAKDSIRDLKPLNKFTNLESIRFNDCQIDDVSPLRSILSLKHFEANNTLLNNLNDLQFLSALESISIDNVAIYDLSVSNSWTSLEDLSMASSPIIDLSFLADIPSLKELNLSSNKTEDFSVLDSLENLISLNLSSTYFEDITDINKLVKLHSIYLDETPLTILNGINDSLKIEILSVENTKVADLMPLKDLTSIKMIYCDNSLVELENVKQFIAVNPGVLVIYETISLQNWWMTLNDNLKTFIRSRFDTISEPPHTETLHQIIFTETANLAGQNTINSIEGFQQLINLKSLDISETLVTDLKPVSGISQLSEVNVSSTPIEDVSPLAGNTELKILDIQKTSVKDLSSLIELKNIELIKADDSGVNQEEALRFTSQNNALLLYQSSHLIQWWETLEEDWVHFFSKKMGFNKNPSAKELQALVNTDSLDIASLSGVALQPLEEFKLLAYLKLDHMDTKDLSSLLVLSNLKSLSINNGLVEDVLSIGKMTQLVSLDFSTTSLSDLTFISGLGGITSLNLSGTGVVNIKAVVALTKLEYLDLSNTRIKKISFLNNLSTLKELKLTNTALTPRKIDTFKRQRPDVKVIIY